MRSDIDTQGSSRRKPPKEEIRLLWSRQKYFDSSAPAQATKKTNRCLVVSYCTGEAMKP